MGVGISMASVACQSAPHPAHCFLDWQLCLCCWNPPTVSSSVWEGECVRHSTSEVRLVCVYWIWDFLYFKLHFLQQRAMNNGRLWRCTLHAFTLHLKWFPLTLATSGLKSQNQCNTNASKKTLERRYSQRTITLDLRRLFSLFWTERERTVKVPRQLIFPEIDINR